MRAHHPRGLIAWSRLIRGRWLDPWVGRDVLIGGLGGLLGAVLVSVGRLSPAWTSQGEPLLNLRSAQQIAGLAGTLERLVWAAQSAVFIGLLAVLLLALLHRLSRQQWLVMGLFTIFCGALGAPWANPVLGVPLAWAFIGALGGWLASQSVLRFIAAVFFFVNLEHLPIATDLWAWYALPTWIGIGGQAMLLVLAAWVAQRKPSEVSEQSNPLTSQGIGAGVVERPDRGVFDIGRSLIDDDGSSREPPRRQGRREASKD
jgi:hypothetical protein